MQSADWRRRWNDGSGRPFEPRGFRRRSRKGRAAARREVDCALWTSTEPHDALPNQTAHIFRKYDDQAFSMTDCRSFALCESLEITQAVTPDSHFEIMGINRAGV